MNLKYLMVLIGILLFVYILWTSNATGIFSALSNVDIGFFMAALALNISLMVLKGLKWNVLIKTFDKNYSLISSIKNWLIGFSFGAVTPGRFGDFMRAFYLKKEAKTDFGKALSSVVIDRIADLASLFIFAIIGLYFIVQRSWLDLQTIYIILFLFALFLLGTVFLFSKNKAKFILKPLFTHMVPQKYKKKLRYSFHDFYRGIKEIFSFKKAVIKFSVLTVVAYMIIIFQSYFLALSLGIFIPVTLLFFIMSIVFLVELLPISISGLGTRDLTLIFFFSFFALSRELAISFSLLLLLMNIISTLLGAGIFISKRGELA